MGNGIGRASPQHPLAKAARRVRRRFALAEEGEERLAGHPRVDAGDAGVALAIAIRSGRTDDEVGEAFDVDVARPADGEAEFGVTTSISTRWRGGVPCGGECPTNREYWC